MSQMISHRRELGNCRICWYTDADTDVQIAKTANTGVADSKVSIFVSYFSCILFTYSDSIISSVVAMELME